MEIRLDVTDATRTSEHCFCRQNSVGQPMCCECGLSVGGKILNLEWFMREEQAGHKNRREK